MNPGMQVGDHVKINHPGWYGDGEVGCIAYFGALSSAAYVRIPNRECYRHEVQFLTPVEAPVNCDQGCCLGPVTPWEFDERREVLRQAFLDL